MFGKKSPDTFSLNSTESKEERHKTTYALKKVSVLPGEHSNISAGWSKQHVVLEGEVQVGAPLYWSSEDGEHGSTSKVVEIEKDASGSLFIYTDTSIYKLSLEDAGPVSGESFQNHFLLKKLSVKEGQSSAIDDGWQSEVSLSAKPEVGNGLLWIETKGGKGHSSTIEAIDQISDTVWHIKTRTSVYELVYLGVNKKENSDVVGFDIEKILKDSRTPQEVVNALQEKSFQPIESISIDGHEFFVSPIISGGSRDTVIAYTFDENGIARLRMFYQSNSDGGWRLNAPNNNQQLSKGLSYSKYGYRHYTKETKPHELLVRQFDRLPIINDTGFGDGSLYGKQRSVRDLYKNSDNLTQYITETGVVENYPLYYDSLVKSGIHIDNKVARGQVYGHNPLDINRLRGIEFPPGFVPEFSQEPLSIYYQSHTLFSERDDHGKLLQDVRVEIYEGMVIKTDGNQEKLFWHMATDAAGRVWVERIIPESSKVNSFGIYNQIYDFGVLDLKPVDYKQQVVLIPKEFRAPYLDGEYMTDYDDITPFLAELSPIKLYKHYRVEL